jgi:hypothetical protein
MIAVVNEKAGRKINVLIFICPKRLPPFDKDRADQSGYRLAAVRGWD